MIIQHLRDWWILTFSWIAVALICLVLLEMCIAVVMRTPSFWIGGVLTAARDYYLNYERRVPQYLPDCASYDADLSYRMQPGRCHVEEREYTTDYVFNQVGLRDDDADLDSPGIIVLGDSHTMGWGVNEGEDFASVIQKLENTRTLNAGVASYGTARELQLLSELDVSNLRTLIIQYCNNDLEENAAVLENLQHAHITETQYREIVQTHDAQTRYVFGKYTFRFALIGYRLLKELFRRSSSADSTDSKEAEYFLELLRSTSVDLSDVKLIVLEINGYGLNDSRFAESLRERFFQDPLQVGAFHVLDMSKYLTSDHYYLLDDHLNASGQEQVGSVISEYTGQITDRRP